MAEGQMVKNPLANGGDTRDAGLIPGSGRSPGGGHGPTLTSIHDYWKNHSFDYKDICCKIMSLFFNILSRFVIVFLSRSKCLLISWL